LKLLYLLKFDVFQLFCYFQRMLKSTESMNEMELRGREALEGLLSQVPIVSIDSLEWKPVIARSEVDLIVRLQTAGQPYQLLCEILFNGQPRYVSHALLKMREYVARSGPDVIPILIAPYFSPATRDACQQNQVGYLDLEGNARISFGGVFIDRQVSVKPVVERRELKSLFRPRSAQVLRVMLRAPERIWRVVELAQTSAVSLGHVSNVRAALLDREWATASSDGLYLSQPNALLDAWRGSYETPVRERKCFYTTLHGSALEDAARDVLGASGTHEPEVAFASFSAAKWLAPYARTSTQYFYATLTGLEKLKTALKLAPSAKGENVVIMLPKDAGLLSDTVEPAPGAVCTSPVQTYLDLCIAGERGEEAAQHLRQERMTWPA
jgi:hypothetical protein